MACLWGQFSLRNSANCVEIGGAWRTAAFPKSGHSDHQKLSEFKGAVIATATMSLPLVARTAKATFEGINPRLEMMAQTLGHSRLTTFFQYSLPMARRGLLAAVILGFTRAMGEFGATVTIAGNIPGRTQTVAGALRL